jgi:[ribosomal protein S5]-alanine N-acetyltransferase
MSFTSLKSPRLELRPFQPADITPAYIGWLNDPRVVRFSNQRFKTHDRVSCEAYLQSFQDSEDLFLSIRLAGRDSALGTMTAYRNAHHGTADVGIMLGDASAWGKGIGLEAWQLLTDWLLGEGGTRKVTAGTLACNPGMIRIAAKSGMALEGRRLKQEIVEGEPQDILYFGRFAA